MTPAGTDAVRYFSYGSNMLLERMLRRVPGARLLGPARLDGYRLAWHKANVDGSGKCDVVPDGGSVVWGVLYEIDADGRSALDGFEGLGRGYTDETVRLDHDGGSVEAFIYRAISVSDGLLPYRWYRDMVLMGAEENRLPADYVDSIRAVPVLEDPDEDRRRNNEKLLGR